MADFCRDWLGTQLPPSYMGIPFEVNQDVAEGGRRIYTHEYASAEFWNNEDLGRDKRTMNVTGFVDGDDADLRAEALFDACSAEGPGLLVLPLSPPMMARCDKVSRTFQKDGQGRFTFSMQFIAEPLQGLGFFSFTQLSAIVQIAVGAAFASAAAAFSAGFDTILRRFSPARYVPALARDASAITIGLAAEAMSRVLTSCRIGSAKGADIAFTLRWIKTNAAAMAVQGQRPNIVSASTFVAAQVTVDNGFSALFIKAARAIADNADPADLMAALPALVAFTPQTFRSKSTAFSVRAETVLAGEVATLVRRCALIMWMTAISRQRYTARGLAITARAELVQAFDAENDTAMRAALDAAINYLSRTISRLPSTVALSLIAPMPAAVLATRLYADPSRGAEIIAWNDDCDPIYPPLELQAAAS